MTTEIIRHGKTPFNVVGRVTGQHDVPIIPQAIPAIEALSKRLLIREPRLIHSSDLRRAEQTAIVVRHALASPAEIRTDYRLREVHHGIHQRDDKYELTQEVPAYRRDPHYAAPGGESYYDAYTRVGRWLEDHPLEDTIVVCHAGTMRILYSHLTGTPLEETIRYRIPNDTILRLQGEAVFDPPLPAART